MIRGMFYKKALVNSQSKIQMCGVTEVHTRGFMAFSKKVILFLI